METIYYEVYVSLEIAKLLKEAGFDWEVEKFWWYDKQDRKYILSILRPKSNGYFAPTLDVAQRWLREFHKVHILIDCIAAKRWEITLQYFNGNDIKIEDNEFTYEKAQEAGIRKALEIILKKGE